MIARLSVTDISQEPNVSYKNTTKNMRECHGYNIIDQR